MDSARLNRTRWSTATVLWIGVLAIMSTFQLWRGALVDGILFAAIVVMLIVDRATGGRLVVIRRAADAPRFVVIGVAAVIGTVLIIAPRHSTIDAVAMGVAGALAVVLAWNPAGTRPERPASAYQRSAVIWSLLAVALCLWEAGAYVASVTVSERDFPTISVLLDPFVDLPVGRIVFTVLWILGGLALVNAWRKR